MTSKAFITGIAGQDGSYLAELLLSKGYTVYGIDRPQSLEEHSKKQGRLAGIKDQLKLIPSTEDQYSSTLEIVQKIEPQEIYHLAAQSFVSYDFADEFNTIKNNIDNTHYLLAANKELVQPAKFFFATSREMFGDCIDSQLNEQTPFAPQSIYGISKVAGFHLAQYYRKAYGHHISCGILFNHESPRRSPAFVTRKITSHVAMIKLGLKDHLELGNLDTQRDWGHAKDFVKAMWLMLQQEKPDDYLLCTGQIHSVRDFCQQAFSHANLNYQDFVKSKDEFIRPIESGVAQGDNTKAREQLDWSPTISFDEMIKEMVDADLNHYSEQKPS